MRSAVSKGGGNASSARESKVWRSLHGHEGESQIQTRRTWSRLWWFSGGQGVPREGESEGHAEKYRAVVEGAVPKTNRSAKGGTRSSPHYGGEGVLIHPPHQGVCGRHGTEDQCVTPGGLVELSGGTERSDSISESEVSRGARRVVGRPSSTRSAVKAARPSNRRSECDRGRRPAEAEGTRRQARE
jgi:hypothetical protein